jgi:transposase
VERISSTKKARVSRSKINVLLVVFFGWKSFVHHKFVPRDQMENRQLYQEVLARLREAMRRKRPKLWENQTWMLHHDNAPAHASLLIHSYLAKHQTSVVPHPPYFPELVPADIFLFPKVKTTLKGRRFQITDEIQKNAIRELRAITESAFQELFQQWKKCWERCVTSRGDCFEVDSA